VAFTENVTTAPHDPGSVSTEMSEGQSIAGSSLSVTVTVNEQLIVFPFTSVASETTVVVPIGKK
jgi:hypothetical protein